jgi:transposase
MSNAPKSSVPVPPESLVIGRKDDGRAIYDAGAKQALVLHCLQPGVSVAGAALQAGVNANLLRKWILRHQRASGACEPAAQRRRAKSAGTLIPVVLDERVPSPATTAPAQATALTIEIEGARIGVAPGFDAATLRAVVQLLRTTRA